MPLNPGVQGAGQQADSLVKTCASLAKYLEGVRVARGKVPETKDERSSKTTFFNQHI